ncbi:MAG: hypothetical protein EHM48_04010 [Planctomycetaceae bacterium]|nr:MAG: hypothetical protein EHM48_04010 [Planctomycetaceae bacterium]
MPEATKSVAQDANGQARVEFQHGFLRYYYADGGPTIHNTFGQPALPNPYSVVNLTRNNSDTIIKNHAANVKFCRTFYQGRE